MFQTRNILNVLKNSLFSLSNKQSRIHNLRCQSRFLSTLESDDEDENSDLMKDVLPYRSDASGTARKVFIVMPRKKFGDTHRTMESAQSLMEETKTLVESIEGWNVIGSDIMSTSNIKSRYIFGSTNLNVLRDEVKFSGANTVVFSLDFITPPQHHFFQEHFNMEVFDRFGVVLKIFKERAKTREAKLQLSLAELYYVKRNLHHLTESDFNKFSVAESFGGNFDTFYQIKKKLIQDIENKIKKKLEKIDRDMAIQRQHRIRNEIPTVAVVGYTNSGKTSLIKALTHDKRLAPEDKLFATLSTSIHMAHSPSSNMTVQYVDTIGFITEIPTTLIHCFKSTLSEISYADLIVHVADVSHPDYELQIKTVNETLREINVSEKLLETMIQVENKVDKLDDKRFEDLFNKNNESFFISATERIGLRELDQHIMRRIIKNTDRISFKIRVPNGGDQYQWLRKEVTVVDCFPDPKQDDFMILEVIMTKSQIGKFKKLFD